MPMIRPLLLAASLALAVASTACQSASPVTAAATADFLKAPPAGEGVQLTVGPFDVPAGTEVQKNFFMKLPVDQDVAIKHIEIAYPRGSHHCNIFKCDTQTFPDHVEDSFDAVPYEIFDMFAAAQTGELDWTLPEGVAIKLHKQQQLIIQTHWVNAVTQKTPDSKGVVKINFWFAKPEEVKMTMGMLFAINKNIDIQPHTTIDQTKTVDLAKLGWNKDVTIAAMTGHFHSRGKAFDVSRWDGKTKGESIYHSNNWDEPPFVHDAGTTLKAGEKLLYTSTFQNDSDMVIKFGPHVENQEHSNLFMYFYPGPDNGKALYDVDGLP